MLLFLSTGYVQTISADFLDTWWKDGTKDQLIKSAESDLLVFRHNNKNLTPKIMFN